METTLNSTDGLIPMLLSLVGVLVTLQYLKGMTDFSKAIRFIFWGFVCIFASKLLIFVSRSIPEGYYYFFSLLLHLCSAVFLIAGSLSIKGVKFFNRTVVITSCLLAAVWSWYVVIITRDGNTLTLSLATSTAGYGFLAASLWRRKNLRNSIGFVITGWLCIFLVLYNLLSLMSWGQSLLSPAFETFLYIAIMCGWILISNNMMAHQFDTLEQEAEGSKERLRLMIQMSPFPIIISRLKDDQLMLINNKAGSLFGLDVKHPGNFKTIDYFAEPSKRTELLTKLEKHPVVDDFEFLVKPRKGDPFWLLLSARVIDFEFEIALYMAFQDITDRKKKELQLFDQATKDPLTKCYNRRQFEELARNEIQRSRRYNHAFCLFMIDADHFKNVNDTHGHAVGDLVLQALADCCRRTLRESDIVARFGGEEFVILLPEASIENAHRVAERLRIKISKLVVKNEQNQDVRFTVSIGLVSSTVTDDVAEMLKMADESLYVAKENGRNQVIVYESTGPNKDLPKPEGEDIDKTNAEPLFYFKPAGAPSVKNQMEPKETGVVGLSGETGHEEEPSLDDEDEVRSAKSSGVSLSALYDSDDDDAPVAVARPTPVPPPVFEPVVQTDQSMLDDEPLPVAGMPGEDPFQESFSAEIEQEPEFGDEEPLPSVETVDYEQEELPIEDEQEAIPDADYLPEDQEIPAEAFEEEALIEEEIAFEEEETIPPLAESQEPSFAPEFENDLNEIQTEPEPELPTEEEEEISFEPPVELPADDEPMPVAEMPGEEAFLADVPVVEEDVTEEEILVETQQQIPQAVPPPAPRPQMVKVMKKLPIKMPAGMVKMPKMPGVVRVKIPKALHQSGAPVPPKPESAQE